MSRNETEEAVFVVFFGYINGIQLAKFGLLIDKTSSIYTKVRLRALGSVFFICLLV
jgi:hypothetical protein